MSRFLDIDSRNSSALSRDCFSSRSYPSKSNNLAPDSVISLASYLAALRLCNLELMLKSIIELLSPKPSSSMMFSLDCMALYIIVAIFKSSFTANPEASYNFFGLRTILALLAKS